MNDGDLTDSELLVLGLVSEMPRHGYELEQIIEERGMREWTRIGFSSIYYVLNRLEQRGLIAADTPANARAKKSYTLTAEGMAVLVDQTIATLATVQPTYPSLLLGMLHLPVLTRNQALTALRARQSALAAEIDRVERIHLEQQPLPDYVDAIFEFSLGQLKTEAAWLEWHLDYLAAKTWDAPSA